MPLARTESQITTAGVANHAVEFFDRQFRAQIDAREFVLNPFEQAVLPYLDADVLDLGCGLGNLAIAAARKGCRVTALDGSQAAVEGLTSRARKEELPIAARKADLAGSDFAGDFDAVVAVGLLMFFPRPRSANMLVAMQKATRPGGIAAVNVLTEGTTFMDMFAPDHFTLFGRDEVEHAFAGWDILLSRHDGFDAPRGTRKEFSTVVARKPR
jgi:tellurite methyltransferase